jgi:pimeloyl-ACP methyl ester carboxylesterase
LTTANTQLHYEIAGEGETVILGHAGFVDSRMWDAQWAAFTEHYQVLRFDMQGYGASGVATQPISRCDEVLGLMDTLEIEKAHLIGCSLSGAAYIDFALTHPDKVISLTVVNAAPTGFEMQGEPPHYMMEMFGALQQGEFDYASELQLRIWIDGIYREPDAVDGDLRQKAAEMNQITVQNQTFMIADMQPANPLDPPAISRLHDIQCPVLVLDSTLDHPEMNRAAGLMASQMPQAVRQTIEGAAHLPNMEKPELFNRMVLDFLGEMPVG